MDIIVGLGSAGCNIADQFAKYPQYRTYKIDVGLEKTKTTFPLPQFSKTEDYEKKLPNLQYFFRGVRGEVLFVVGGSGSVSSASLAVLKHLKNKCKINVLYVKPDMSFLSPLKQKLERMVYNVFQEYARSGLFERLYIVSNSELENIIGGVPVKLYNEKINEILVSTMHMINKYNHIQSVDDTFYVLPPGARITTIGIASPEKNVDNMFFTLDSVSDIMYYYAYNKERLENDSSLMKQIKMSINEKTTDNVRVSYGIFETEYEQDYVYCVKHTSIIQK